MFDFEQLHVYQKALELNKNIFIFLKSNKQIDFFLQDQLKRASVSIVLNIAEGVGRSTKLDRKRFYIISKSSAFETAACLSVINNQYSIDQDWLKRTRAELESIVKMLFSLIKKVQVKYSPET